MSRRRARGACSALAHPRGMARHRRRDSQATQRRPRRPGARAHPRMDEVPSVPRLLPSQPSRGEGRGEGSGHVFTSAVLRQPFRATVSLWENSEAVMDYAFSGHQVGHPEAIAAGRAKPFHHETSLHPPRHRRGPRFTHWAQPTATGLRLRLTPQPTPWHVLSTASQLRRSNGVGLDRGAHRFTESALVGPSTSDHGYRDQRRDEPTQLSGRRHLVVDRVQRAPGPGALEPFDDRRDDRAVGSYRFDGAGRRRVPTPTSPSPCSASYPPAPRAVRVRSSRTDCP